MYICCVVLRLKCCNDFFVQIAVLSCKQRQDKKEHLDKVVSSAKEADLIFQELHCGPLGSHCGVEKTHHAIIS